MKKFNISKKFIKINDLDENLEDFLPQKLQISKEGVKKLIAFGGVYLVKNKKRLRLRKNKFSLKKGDQVEVFYDEKLLKQKIEQSYPIIDYKDWGVWYKPAGLLSQGSLFGDLASIERQVEIKKGQSFLIHRLDREAFGLMIFAYTKKMAQFFNEQLKNFQIKKEYLVLVIGNPNFLDQPTKLCHTLDGKEAKLFVKQLNYSPQTNLSLLEIELITGRTHQIRRQMQAIGHPVFGDPKYGENNKNDLGLALVAYKLSFKNPTTNKDESITLPIDIYKNGPFLFFNS